MTEKIKEAFVRLSGYCEKEGYKGYDPYDGLNSSLFRSIPFIRSSRLFRLAWIQFFKRSPLNLRPITGVEKGYNPKALGLFLSGYCNLQKYDPRDEYLQKIKFFGEKIDELQNRNYSGSCWGYNFDWQARAFFQPANTPTVVATTFVGCALLDAWEITGNRKYLDMARSACDFILQDLNRTTDPNKTFAFSYSPLDRSVVYNASLLGSRLLSRVYSITSEKDLIGPARKSVEFCCSHQHPDGSWSYGLQPFHKWIDNFHTGYNLECISDFIKFTGENQFRQNVERGFQYYINNFFTEEGIPKYYNNSIYPVDIHCTSQLVITLSRLGRYREFRDLAEKVLNWTIDNMQSDKGFFYYQVNKYFSSRIPYMRWAQAWMFYSLAEYLLLNRN
jgi:rhamnogalacturonyl hydrolase YesR